MTTLASTLAAVVRGRIDQAGGELRLIFHGPPLDILGQAFELLLTGASGDHDVPLLLQVPQLETGETNPAIGESGLCNATHLLNLRNSPSKPAYVALVPPGLHSSKSVATTTDEFGVAATNNGGNVPFEEWWADEFVQELVAAGVAACGVQEIQREAARSVVERGTSAADEVDIERTQRAGAWRVLSRLFSAGSLVELAPASRVALACGLPPMADGSLSAKEQLAVLGKVADALADGFTSGIEKAREAASDDDAARLSEFLAHLKHVCESPTGFERAPEAYYAPNQRLGSPTPPAWWLGLTVEKWTELLAEEATEVGDIHMICSNGLIPLAKGMPFLVDSAVELEFETKGPDASNALVTIERTPGVQGVKQIGQVRADSGRAFVDDRAPSHRSPLRYVASAPGFKSGAIKVISLATWQPGIFVACRLATKLSPPKRAKGRSGPDLEAGLLLPGAGRYELQVFASPSVEIEDVAEGNTDDAAQRGDAATSLPVRAARGRQYQVEVELDGNYQVDFHLSRAASDGTVSRETCRVYLTVEEVPQQGCRSEFERLIRTNRRSIQPSEARALVQVDRNARASSLQDWMLSSDSIARSYQPIVLAEDYVDAWVQPTWSEPVGPILSRGRFIKDPRPSPASFQPPSGFLEARYAIAERIRGGGEQTGLVESAELGKWCRDDAAFSGLVEQYLSAYQAWLAAEPEVACWVDVIAVTGLENDGRTLSRTPQAVLLSPLHPVRIAWHTVAQQVLLESDEADKPCPAASVLDPDCVPDLLTLALQSPGGVEWVDFLAVENGTDYWSVLWNGRQLSDLPERSRRAPFGDAFGISVGGISVGFSAAQVARALEDVSDLLAAKPLLGVAVASAGGTTDACNAGLISWCSRRYEDDGTRPVRQSVGPRLIEIYDERDDSSRPDDATIANLCEDTRNSVRWFDRQPVGAAPDLGIIAQLDMSEPSATTVANRTPLGQAALIRHRIRRQLPDAFLSESRQCLPPIATGDPLADKLGACVAAIENLGETRTGMTFAPNVNSIHHMLEVAKTDFVAVSSSAIDPACFLGGWLKGTYLWDYDLPSYSHRAGDTNGYYLLSRVKDADREALAKALARLPGCSEMDAVRVQDVLLEVARRGIPTIRGLAGDNSGATGDLGLFLAVRLLQDRFRVSGQVESLLPVVAGTESEALIAIVVPVDPFQGYLSDLGRALRNERRDATFERPDLLVIGVRISGSAVSLHLTPVEVKCRPGSAFPSGEVTDALNQAKNLSGLLSAMLPSEEQPRAWALAFQHLLLSLLGFGMRVYSQHPDVVDQERWSKFHEQIAAAILGRECNITIDERGRLVIVDDSPRSRARDHDNDGFDETITIGLEDAGRMVSGDPIDFYDSVRAKVGDWGFLPEKADPPLPSAPVPEPSRPSLPPPSSPRAVDEVPAVPAPRMPAPSNPPQVAAGGITLDVGSTVDGFQPREVALNISDTRLNHLNMGVVGDLGTGKTQLLKSLILQISRSAASNRGMRPRFLIFDYKRDYSSEDFVAATGARVVRPHKLPINLFDTSSMEETTAPWLHRYRFFADVLEKIYSGIGPVQRDKLKRAVKSAYDSALPGSPPTLRDVHAAYADIMEGKADSPMSIIGDLIDMEVFAEDHGDTIPFNEFLDGVVVISLDALGQDDHSKNMLVAVMLNLFYENMLRTPKRPFLGTDPQLRALDAYLLVDEADNIMRYEFDVLRKLLLQAREFGTGIILASQYLRHFKVNGTDYREPLLTWFIHKVPNVTPAELGALGLTGSVGELAERVKSLQNHQCLYKSFDVPGEVVRGLPFFELVQRKSQG